MLKYGVCQYLCQAGLEDVCHVIFQVELVMVRHVEGWVYDV